ncbi:MULTISPECIES: hypothetical protein [Methanosarcina]|uniref:Uncharacterized protein n=3 Tax=Methanosarcina barkeri TaxID=2208 RepID=A0A0E3QRR2_METBA|nr:MULTISPECIES: hypothetical protein [Methanosarcina]AKB53908.1 hypothetical protein MSBRM_0910 [Methanosarcina barkeri MS]AKB58000.1 hypothetical protein MSBR2_1484 [Methanosarcina barkeri 227]AKJ39716.1 hypothetical protein MCM1_2715 [Methanosarcina barkeri CM1]OED10380.1 hypothetical protein A9239_07255 [Methanosarcina sp. A14]
MSHDITRDRNIEEDENYEGADLELRDIPLPNTDNILYSILNSLNHNIANFYAYTKFKDYISEKTLDMELLQRSMSIHRDFSALFLHTKEELVLVYPDFLEKAEKLLFKGDTGTDFINYTRKLCKLIGDYKKILYREGYLPDL